MEDQNKYIEEFDAYFEDRLNDEDKLAFEEQLKNEDFKGSYDSYILARNAVKLEGRKKLLEKINSIGDNINQSEHTKTIKITTMKDQQKKQSKSWIGIAAGFAILLAAGAWFMTQTNSTNPEELFANNYKAESNLTAKYMDEIATSGFASGNPADTASAESIIDPLALEAMAKEEARQNQLVNSLNKFKKGNWAEARKSLNTYMDTYPEPIDDQQVAQYFFGKSCLNMSDYAVAADYIGKVVVSNPNDKDLLNAAKYDLASTYIMVDKSQAIKYFEDIAGDNGHPNMQDAKGILEGLK